MRPTDCSAAFAVITKSEAHAHKSFPPLKAQIPLVLVCVTALNTISLYVNYYLGAYSTLSMVLGGKGDTDWTPDAPLVDHLLHYLRYILNVLPPCPP